MWITLGRCTKTVTINYKYSLTIEHKRERGSREKTLQVLLETGREKTWRVLLETAKKFCARRRKLLGVLSKEMIEMSADTGHVSVRFAGIEILC